MKTIIAGSRSITSYPIVCAAITNSKFKITEIVSGTARGVDRLGEEYAIYFNTPIKRMPANWGKYGKSAGPIRNREMAEYADALIAVWDGKSKGTANMIEVSKEFGLKVFVYTP